MTGVSLWTTANLPGLWLIRTVLAPGLKEVAHKVNLLFNSPDLDELDKQILEFYVKRLSFTLKAIRQAVLYLELILWQGHCAARRLNSALCFLVLALFKAVFFQFPGILCHCKGVRSPTHAC